MLKDAVSTGLKANDSLSIALFGYDIHELLLHDDDAANRKVTHKLLDVRIAECGSADFISKARRLRKLLGGGMRQAGILAAAGIVALDEMVERLAEDHRRAAALGEGLRGIPGVHLTKNSPQTNMVFFRLDESLARSTDEFLQAMKQEGVLLMDSGPGEFRMVTHHDINDAAVEAAIASFRKVLA